LTAEALIAALLTFPLSFLPAPFVPFVAVLLSGYLGVSIFVMRQGGIVSIFRSFRSGEGSEERRVMSSGATAEATLVYLASHWCGSHP